MKIPYEDGIKWMVLGAILIIVAWFLNPGWLPRDAEPTPIPLLLLVSGLGCGVLGFIKIGQELS